MTPKTELPLVIVEWDDAVDLDGPVSLADADSKHKPLRVTTIGWLMKQDEKGVLIANEFYEDQYRGVGFILQEMVRAITPYKLAKPKSKKPSSGGSSSTAQLPESDGKL